MRTDKPQQKRERDSKTKLEKRNAQRLSVRRDTALCQADSRSKLGDKIITRFVNMKAIEAKIVVLGSQGKRIHFA